jgi:hypothetical protein
MRFRAVGPNAVMMVVMALTEKREPPWDPGQKRQRREGPWDPSEPRQRRRPRWGEFREAYPRIVTAAALGVAILLAFDGWLLFKRLRYAQEIERLRAELSDADGKRADAIMAASENRTRFKIAVVRRDAGVDENLNLAVSLQDGVLYLQREGARLREMPVRVAPAQDVGRPPVKLAPPRGEFAVTRVVDGSFAWPVPEWVYEQRGLPVPSARDRAVRGALGPVALLLSGGAVIYSDPASGPLQDGSYVLPGSVRARVKDLKAIAESLQPGVSVYFY